MYPLHFESVCPLYKVFGLIQLIIKNKKTKQKELGFFVFNCLHFFTLSRSLLYFSCHAHEIFNFLKIQKNKNNYTQKTNRSLLLCSPLSSSCWGALSITNALHFSLHKKSPTPKCRGTARYTCRKNKFPLSGSPLISRVPPQRVGSPLKRLAPREIGAKKRSCTEKSVKKVKKENYYRFLEEGF